MAAPAHNLYDASQLRLTDPDEETFRAKEGFERQRLDAWL